ncbi:hypothetical protein B0H17DRAFT_1147013 [Mycena rosella]|uniref:Uncharacterized protein n=1 Tax=Mycena rosella TaxID=1033263 RepID=A0AAD7G489_MYCRO|nr:hypothetical protein B0H17DRAFT_1147013 [Mycena rosella]
MTVHSTLERLNEFNKLELSSTETFSAKAILTALASAAVSTATPTAAIVPTPTWLTESWQLTPATITVCSGSISPPNGCLTISVVSDSCVNLTGGLSFLNKEISWVQVPNGFVCTFYEDFGCLNGGINGHDVALFIFTGGTWDMFNVHGIAANQNFNDLTSSITCSPI